MSHKYSLDAAELIALIDNGPLKLYRSVDGLLWCGEDPDNLVRWVPKDNLISPVEGKTLLDLEWPIRPKQAAHSILRRGEDYGTFYGDHFVPGKDFGKS